MRQSNSTRLPIQKETAAQSTRKRDDLVQQTQSAKKKVDVTLVIDATASMGPYLMAIVAALNFLIDCLVDSALSVAIALVIFRDELTGQETRLYPVGTPPDELKAVLHNTMPEDGGDEPESALPAIHKALTLPGYRQGAQKVLLLITDAHCHMNEAGLVPGMITEELTKCNALFFACAPDVPPYVEFVNATHGTLFAIKPDLDADTFRSILGALAAKTVKTIKMNEDLEVARKFSDEIRKTIKLS